MKLLKSIISLSVVALGLSAASYASAYPTNGTIANHVATHASSVEAGLVPTPFGDTTQQAQRMMGGANMMIVASMAQLGVGVGTSMIEYEAAMLSASIAEEQKLLQENEATTDQMQQMINQTNQQMNALLSTMSEEISATSSVLAGMQNPVDNFSK